MKASAIVEALRSLFKVRQPVFIWGGPGCGKSAVTRQTAAALNSNWEIERHCSAPIR